MKLPAKDLCAKEPLMNMFRQGDEREYFNPRKGANQRFLIRNRINSALDYLSKHLSKDKSSPVADFACGTGTFGLLLAERGYPVDFIDNKAKFLEYTKLKSTSGNINFIEADASKLNSNKKYFSIFFGEALEHMENPEETLKVLRDNLLTGGLLCLTTPNGDFFQCKEPKWSDVKGNDERNKKLANTLGNHVCEFGYDELANLLKEAGFGILEHKLINSHQISRRKILRRILPESILRKLDLIWAKQKDKNGKHFGRIQIIVAQRFH